MAKHSKYEPLTQLLQQCGKETVHFTFEELNRIIVIPNYAYNDRPAWANCTTKNATPFQRGWMQAGYNVSDISLTARYVKFSKNDIVIYPKLHKASDVRKQHKIVLKTKRIVPKMRREEILLTVPNNLITLKKDKYFMVALNKYNSDIVEECIKNDPAYQSKGKAIMEKYFNAEDYSETAYEKIISCIATENSTRTPNEAIKYLAKYCADPNMKFLNRLNEGDKKLVDDMLTYLVNRGSRKDKSLVSKVCRYLNEWKYNSCAYTINDSVVRAIMPYYLAYYKIDQQLWYDKNFEEMSYLDFYNIFSKLREKILVLNNHELDHLIWYSYKNDSIRSEITKALAKIL